MKRLIGLALALGFGMAQQAQAGICSTCLPEESGDLLHRASGIDAAFVGHAGINLEEGVIADVTLRGPGRALDMVDLTTFLAGNTMWGAKRPKDRPQNIDADAATLWQMRIRDKLEYFRRVGVTYDATHLSQKGTSRDDDGHFLFDCVGFTEHVLEYLGHNPTADEYESGAGWPLTPREQRDSDRLEDVRS